MGWKNQSVTVDGSILGGAPPPVPVKKRQKGRQSGFKSKSKKICKYCNETNNPNWARCKGMANYKKFCVNYPNDGKGGGEGDGQGEDGEFENGGGQEVENNRMDVDCVEGEGLNNNPNRGG